MMTPDEMIAVIQAHKEGKELECRRSGDHTTEWDCAFPSFQFDDYDYRIKPEPKKPREWWLYGGTHHSWHDPNWLGSVHVREVLSEE